MHFLLPTFLQRGALSDHSGTVSGTTSIQIMDINLRRHYLLIEAVGASDLWINFGTPAVKSSPSILIKGGANAQPFIMSGFFVCTDAVWIIKDGTGNSGFTAKQG